jgi:hypothetical protein
MNSTAASSASVRLPVAASFRANNRLEVSGESTRRASNSRSACTLGMFAHKPSRKPGSASAIRVGSSPG